MVKNNQMLIILLSLLYVQIKNAFYLLEVILGNGL
jgi:hypothetical protein